MFRRSASDGAPFLFSMKISLRMHGADIPPRSAPSYRHFSAEIVTLREKNILRAL